MKNNPQNANTLHTTPNYLEPTLILEHLIDANTTAVYDAWTELDTLKKWFKPTGFTVAKAELVAKEGGYFIIHMQSPEGEIYPTKGEYILLERPNRIVYQDSWDDERPNNEPIVAEIRFIDAGDKTRIQLFSSFASNEQKDQTLKSGVADGWKMFFENLNATLTKN